MDISLSPAEEAAVHARVASGQYASPDAVIAAGLRLLMARDENAQAVVQMQEMIAPAVARLWGVAAPSPSGKQTLRKTEDPRDVPPAPTPPTHPTE